MAPASKMKSVKKLRCIQRSYDGMIGTFTSNGVVDEETQKNDLEIVREVLKVTKEVPIERAYDFSFAKKADIELIQAGWKP